MVAALAAVNDWEIHVVDVKTAFLRAPLEEEGHLRQPPELSGRTRHGLSFRPALYAEAIPGLGAGMGRFLLAGVQEVCL